MMIGKIRDSLELMTLTHDLPHRIFFAILLLFFLSTPQAFGDVDFSLEPKIGVNYGMVREIVYPVGYDTDNPYLSELRWDIKPAVMLGLGAGLVTKGHLSFNLDVQGALPISSGEMYDYDWLYLNRDDWSHRSISDIKLSSAFIIDFSIAGPVIHRDTWEIDISAGYHLDWWSWIDSVREYYYTLDGSNYVFPDPPKDYETGDPFLNYEWDGDGETGITYEVAYHIPFFGMGARYSGRFVSLETRFRIGPVLAFDHDHHINRGLHFYDSGIGGPWLGFDARLGLDIWDPGEWFMDVEIVGFPEFSGRVDVYDDNGNFLGSTSKGAGFQFWRLGLTLGYEFTF